MIGIVAAMDVEVQAIMELCEITQEKTIGNVAFHYGKLASKDVVICKSGVGKVGAAMVTTILCLHHSLDALINIGGAAKSVGYRHQQGCPPGRF